MGLLIDFGEYFRRGAGRLGLLAAFGLSACSGLTPNGLVTQGASVVEMQVTGSGVAILTYQPRKV